MQDYLVDLNEEQKAAVTCAEQYVRVVAGAGSGKTRVLTSRIAYLIDKLKVPPKRIVAITFTNKAALEMKKRVEKLGDNEEGKPHISTIHSFCVTVLRQDIVHLKYPRNFTILDAEDQKVILKEAYKKYDFDSKSLRYGAVLDYIGGHKGAGISWQEAKKRAGSFGNEINFALVYEYYVKRQEQLLALDFDDLLLWVKELFLTFPEVLKKWQKKFQVVLVDEFQDIDHVQYEIIRRLVGNDNALYVVGDPDQTIYSWRGADVNIIMNLHQDFPKLKTLLLTTNYRSTATILNAANQLISNNKFRVKKDLVAFNAESVDIVYYGALDEENESLWIAATIKELRARKKVDYDEVAILYRANFLSRSLEKSLVNLNIPYMIYGGIRFYERREIKDILSYLRLLVSEDDLAFKRIINVPRRKIGEKSLSAIQQKSWDEGISMYQVIVSYPEMFEGAVGENIRAFIALIKEMQKKLGKVSLLTITEMIVAESGYKEMLLADQELERWENVKELVNDIENFSYSFPDAGLDEYLQMISLYTDKADDSEEKTVKLMTVHAAKGLEFDTVFVCGLNEGLFPSYRSLEEGIKGLEEERRLAYVAYTRAKERLYLSDSQGFSYVLDKVKTTSRFIKEIGYENLKMLGRVDYSYWQDAHQSDLLVSREAQGKPSVFTDWQVNDKIEHETFHEGIVIKVTPDYVEIAFSYPFGIKKIVKDFPGMRKMS